MNRCEIKKKAKIDAIRSVWRPGICSREIAEALNITKSAVCGVYHRYPLSLKEYPLRPLGRVQGEERRRKPRTQKYISKWSPEQIARIAGLMRAGKTYQQIGDEIGVTRNTISGVIDRTPELRSIKSNRTRPKMSVEERKERQKEAERRYRNTTKRKPFKPIIVSNNVGLMVQDWIAQNGVRRFERGVSADYFAIHLYLKERGYQFGTQQGAKYRLVSPSGRVRSVSWKDAVALVDKFRRVEGLQPFLAA